MSILARIRAWVWPPQEEEALVLEFLPHEVETLNTLGINPEDVPRTAAAKPCQRCLEALLESKPLPAVKAAHDGCHGWHTENPTTRCPYCRRMPIRPTDQGSKKRSGQRLLEVCQDHGSSTELVPLMASGEPCPKCLAGLAKGFSHLQVRVAHQSCHKFPHGSLTCPYCGKLRVGKT